MPSVFITGATGNVGIEVVKALSQQDHQLTIFTGARDVEKERATLAAYKVNPVRFDFLDAATFGPALQGCSVLFLLRPPQIADVEAVFKPLITTAKQGGVQHIVFLSVQGAGNNSFIPHHKIEKLILASGIGCTFLRPAYFMQNFTTTLRQELVERKQIFLPAGNARFTLIDVADIGMVTAHILLNANSFRRAAFDLTNDEQLTFGEMAATISELTGVPIRYTSPNPFRFFMQKRKEKLSTAFILVMIMLHFLPRFQKTPPTTDTVKKFTGQSPASFADFVRRHRHLLMNKAV